MRPRACFYVQDAQRTVLTLIPKDGHPTLDNFSISFMKEERALSRGVPKIKMSHLSPKVTKV
jgi:hypothetical protein